MAAKYFLTETRIERFRFLTIINKRFRKKKKRSQVTKNLEKEGNLTTELIRMITRLKRYRHSDLHCSTRIRGHCAQCAAIPNSLTVPRTYKNTNVSIASYS